MGNDQLQFHLIFRKYVVLFCLGSLVISSFGCEPLRKKFTRKKKQKDVSQEIIPILEPMDYAEKSKTPAEEYMHYYSIWKVWEKDLMENLDQIDNDKRYKYLVGEMIAQLQEMKKWVKEEKQTELALIVDGFKKVLEEFEKPKAVRNMSSLKRQLEIYSKKVRTNFKPQLMQGYYTN